MSTESQQQSPVSQASSADQAQSQQQNPVVDITQRATNPNPTTAPKLKDPKRVEAGKKSAEKRRLARIAQEKALASAQNENEKLKSQHNNDTTRATTTTAAADSSTEHTDHTQRQQAQHSGDNNTNTGGAAFWLTVAGIAVTLITTFVKREDLQALKNYFTKNSNSNVDNNATATRANNAPEPAPRRPPHNTNTNTLRGMD